MMDIENFDNYEIDIADIWLCERSYFFSKEHDLAFASKLIDKTQQIIPKNASPSFGLEMRISDNLYYDSQYEIFVNSLNSIENQFAIDFFFAQEKCFVYSNSIIIRKTNEDYQFWFVLKLRQYDGKLSEIINFLRYQLKNNFSGNFSKFSAHIKFCIRQYPELLSIRVIETVNEWIDNIKNAPIKLKINNKASDDDGQKKSRNEEKKVTDTGNEEKKITETGSEEKKVTDSGSEEKKVTETGSDEKKVSDSGSEEKKVTETGSEEKKVSETGSDEKKVTDSKVKSLTTEPGKNKKPTTSDFIWVGKNNELKSKQLQYLREQLLYNLWIDKIAQAKFDKHFNGIIHDQPINWLVKQYPLIYLIENLKPFMNAAIYNGQNKTISISKFAPHFTWKGKEIKMSVWDKTKSENSKTDDNIYKRIDLIISQMPQ